MLSANLTPKLFIAFTSLFLICVFSALSIAVDRKSGLPEFIRETWLTENGLPQNTVHDIAQTADGYIWIATDGGLARFDGITFTVFDKQNTPELKTGEIHALLADRR